MAAGVPIFQTDKFIYYLLGLGYLIVSCHLLLVTTNIQRLPSEVMLGLKNYHLKKLSELG